MEAIRASGLRLGVDPLGGASVDYWPAIGERYGLDLTVVNQAVDPTFGFMTVDWDGRIRMDPSSPHAMAGLVALRDRFDLAVGNDTDADRHGIVTPAAGLLNPNHFLSAAIAYLFGGARDWGADVAVGKTLVSSAMIDRVVADLGRRLLEVPVGFKWFVAGLIDGSIGFGGEESAGASFLRRDGTTWTTDKDGIIACLLAAEMTARTGRDPGAAYAELTARFGAPAYRRIDAPATPDQKAVLARLSPSAVTATELAGDPVTGILTDGARQRRRDRRPQGLHDPGLVRRPPVGDGERLQGVRGELPRRGAPGASHRGGPGAGGRCAGRGAGERRGRQRDGSQGQDRDAVTTTRPAAAAAPAIVVPAHRRTRPGDRPEPLRDRDLHGSVGRIRRRPGDGRRPPGRCLGLADRPRAGRGGDGLDPRPADRRGAVGLECGRVGAGHRGRGRRARGLDARRGLRRGPDVPAAVTRPLGPALGQQVSLPGRSACRRDGHRSQDGDRAAARRRRSDGDRRQPLRPGAVPTFGRDHDVHRCAPLQV